MTWRVAAKKYALLILKSDYSEQISQQKPVIDNATIANEDNIMSKLE